MTLTMSAVPTSARNGMWAMLGLGHTLLLSVKCSAALDRVCIILTYMNSTSCFHLPEWRSTLMLLWRPHIVATSARLSMLTGLETDTRPQDPGATIGLFSFVSIFISVPKLSRIY
jgi:hypothetical protein